MGGSRLVLRAPAHPGPSLDARDDSMVVSLLRTANYVFFAKETISPIGGLSINFAHYTSDELQRSARGARRRFPAKTGRYGHGVTSPFGRIPM